MPDLIAPSIDVALSSAAFSECEEITDDRPLRQGDVFEWLDSSEDPYRFLGLVITADCDIALAKHHGILSYVPILALTDYLRLFYLPNIIERGRISLEGELTKALLAQEVTDKIRQYQIANRPEFPDPISEQAAVRWVLDGAPSDIADELLIHDTNARKEFLALVTDYKFVDTALNGELFYDQLEAITRLRIRSGLNVERAAKAMWKDIYATVKRLPGDAFFVGYITARLSCGNVAYLRLVREIFEEQLAIRQSDIDLGSNIKAKRIARLRSPYIFGLTQQLAAVFAAVGLPSEYEDHRQRIVQELATSHVRDTKSEGPRP